MTFIKSLTSYNSTLATDDVDDLNDEDDNDEDYDDDGYDNCGPDDDEDSDIKFMYNFFSFIAFLHYFAL